MRVLPVLLVLAAAVSGAAAAQTYPTQPIRIVTSEASGGNDLISRLIAQGIASPLGQPVSVDNRPAGVVPGEIVAKAPADGHTLLIYNNTLWVAPLMRDAAYVATRDFAPIAALARTPNVVVGILHPSWIREEGQELQRCEEVTHGSFCSMPAASKVAISPRILAAASTSPITIQAPVPSPRRKPKSKIGAIPSASSIKLWPVSVDRWEAIRKS